MKRVLLASAIAAILAGPTGIQAAISFDPDGAGGTTAKLIDAFDWNFTSFLALNGQQAIANWISTQGGCVTASCTFDVLTHASLQGATLEGNGVNLGYSGEITMIMRFSETVTSVGQNSETFPENTANFATVPGSGWVEIYYDTAQDSDALTGYNFNDGRLILSGTLVSTSSGSFTVDLDQSTGANQIVKLDSQGTDRYPGQLTVTGHGDQGNLSFQNLVTDPTFFLTALAEFGLEFANISVNLPFISTNPSDCFTVANAGTAAVGTSPAVPAGSCDNLHTDGLMSVQTDPGANAIVPNIGTTNGLLTPGIAFGPDFMAQTDFNSPLRAAIPEPSVISLLGLGLAGIGVVGSRRRRTC